MSCKELVSSIYEHRGAPKGRRWNSSSGHPALLVKSLSWPLKDAYDMIRKRAEQQRDCGFLRVSCWVRPNANLTPWPGLPQTLCYDHSDWCDDIGLRGNTHLLVLCLINPYDERKGGNSLLPQDYLSTNCRLMLLSGTRTVRVMGLIGAAPGSGCTSKWVKIWAKAICSSSSARRLPMQLRLPKPKGRQANGWGAGPSPSQRAGRKVFGSGNWAGSLEVA